MRVPSTIYHDNENLPEDLLQCRSSRHFLVDKRNSFRKGASETLHSYGMRAGSTEDKVYGSVAINAGAEGTGMYLPIGCPSGSVIRIRSFCVGSKFSAYEGSD